MKSKQIKPARRVSNVEEYFFSRKLREVARLNKEGKDIISLAVGGPDLPPAPEVISTLNEEAAKDNSHSYQPLTGIPELREAFSKWYAKWYGVEIDPATELQPLIGSKEGVLQMMLTFLNPGDSVLIPDPGYPTYTSAANIAEAKVLKYQLKPENNWYPDFDALENMDLEGVKMLIANYPHMPTGTPASLEVFEKLVDFGKRHGIVILHDNPYSFILNDKPLSIMQVDGAKDIAVEMNSLSKSHNMAGWRVAVAVSNPEFISWFVKVKSNIDSGQFRPVMLAAAAALNAPDKWYESLNATYRLRRKETEKIMSALGCSFNPDQKGLFVWGKIPDEEKGSAEFADRILADYRIFLTPGCIFGNNGDRYIRISLCSPVDEFRRALKRIVTN